MGQYLPPIARKPGVPQAGDIVVEPAKPRKQAEHACHQRSEHRAMDAHACAPSHDPIAAAVAAHRSAQAVVSLPDGGTLLRRVTSADLTVHRTCRAAVSWELAPVCPGQGCLLAAGWVGRAPVSAERQEWRVPPSRVTVCAGPAGTSLAVLS